MRGKTLISLLDDLRAETRLSGNVAHNASTRERQVNLLQRMQEWLWDDFDWPHLRVERFVDVQAGQRFYDLASAINKDGDIADDLIIDKIEKIEVRHGDKWIELSPGIDATHYNQWDSDKDQRSWPVLRWRIYEDEQIEVWPIPESNADTVSLDGRIKVTGIRKLAPLVEDADRCDLDNRLIVLFAAAEDLAARGAPDAQLKLSAAQKLYAKLRGSLTPTRKIRMFGIGQEPKRVLRGPPSVYYRTTT